MTSIWPSPNLWMHNNSVVCLYCIRCCDSPQEVTNTSIPSVNPPLTVPLQWQLVFKASTLSCSWQFDMRRHCLWLYSTTTAVYMWFQKKWISYISCFSLDVVPLRTCDHSVTSLELDELAWHVNPKRLIRYLTMVIYASEHCVVCSEMLQWCKRGSMLCMLALDVSG